MKHLLLIIAFFGIATEINAQQVYTIKADSVKLTNCDSSELIIENHTQNVPGFLFNTGNGRTIFKRAAQKLNDSAYLIGSDTVKLRSNGWVQGGNAFGTTGILGTLDNNHLDFYSNDSARVRLTKTGNLLLGTSSDNGNKLQVNGSGTFSSITTNPGMDEGYGVTHLSLEAEGSDIDGIGTLGYDMFFQTVNTDRTFHFFFGHMPTSGSAFPKDLNISGGGISGNINISSSNNYIDLQNIQNISTGASPINLFSDGYSNTNGVVVARGNRSVYMTDPIFTVLEADTVVFNALKNGNIGIGTSLPACKLDVNGNARVTGSSTFEGTTFLAGGLTYLNAGLLDYQNASAQLNFPGDGSVGISTGTSGGARRLTIDNTGNTGIGTNTPTAQLHTTGTIRFAGLTSDSTQTRVVVSDADGNLFYRNASSLASNDPARSSLAINGTISAKRLTLSPTGWPDYVFDSSYRLLPMDQMEKYIKQNNHLPGIPSATEVERRGIDVGENQISLLKKIEELTLYNISQEKRLDAQVRRMEIQDKKLEGQEQELSTLKAEVLELKKLLTNKGVD